MVLLMTFVLATAAAFQSGAMSKEDSSCGPRCVQRVLQHYDREVDPLDRLIAELQPGRQPGAKFADLAKALNERSVYCRFVRLGRFSVLDWDEPAIIHVNGNHFAVTTSAGALQSSVWLGSEGEISLDSWELRSNMSDIVLLTSREQIAKEVDCASAWPRWTTIFFCTCSIAVAVLVVWYDRSRFTLRSRNA